MWCSVSLWRLRPLETSSLLPCCLTSCSPASECSSSRWPSLSSSARAQLLNDWGTLCSVINWSFVFLFKMASGLVGKVLFLHRSWPANWDNLQVGPAHRVNLILYTIKSSFIERTQLGAVFDRGWYVRYEEGALHEMEIRRRNWVNSELNFDNILNGMLTLFTISTFEGWPKSVPFFIH